MNWYRCLVCSEHTFLCMGTEPASTVYINCSACNNKIAKIIGKKKAEKANLAARTTHILDREYKPDFSFGTLDKYFLPSY